MGSKTSKIKIKNLLPKTKAYEHLYAASNITLTKNPDSDILFVEIDFAGCFNALVRIWPKIFKIICMPSPPPFDSCVNVIF